MSKKHTKAQEPEKNKTKYDRKMEARKKAAARERRGWIIFRSVCLAILAGAVGTAGYFGITRYIEVHAATTDPYVQVGDHVLTEMEYDYYYNSSVSSYINTYYYYLSYIGLDTSTPYDEQQYSDDMTWEEYFQQITLEQIQKEYALIDDAEANGFEYDPSEDWEEFRSSAKTSAEDQELTMSQYYKSVFGEYATLARLKPLVENSYLSSAYYEQLMEDNAPDDDTVQAYYEENKDDYDTVSFYSFSFDPSDYETEDTTDEDSTEDTASDDTAEDATDEDSTEDTELDASNAQALALAEEMQSRLENGEDFETLCMEYASEDDLSNYEDEDSEYSLTEGSTCSSTNTAYCDWLSDESRQQGDITVIRVEDTGVCYVLKFVNRTYDESCLDTISESLSDDAALEYLNGLLEDAYEVTDLKGEISYLSTTEESTEDSTDESTDDTSDTTAEDDASDDTTEEDGTE